ncbi:MAG: hypothetical protein KC418_11215 [Anaerolineales bacterium]|nr:hypothetical protein [Anaerolineales bacterium]MCB8951468.1 hypothetical protein [Ardenticatenales bacterium]
MSKWHHWWGNLQGELLYRYIRLVTRTTRMIVEGRENLEAAKASGQPVLWALWHQQVMTVVHYIDRFENTAEYSSILVGDERGVTLNRVGERLGAGPSYAVDMQGNPVAAGRAVLQVIKGMKQGYRSVIAPDGPDGPAFVPKDGVFFLAQKAQAAVLPFGAAAQPVIELNRWDRYMVTLPFSRLYYVFGQPIMVGRQSDRESLREQIIGALHAARDRARKLAGA